MRFVSALALVLMAASGGGAFAQGLPADADMRAMQAPTDYEGSRSQEAQGEDPPARAPFGFHLPWQSATAPAPAAPQAAVALNPTHPDYTIDVLDDQGQVVETLARSSSLAMARAAFKEAVKERPGSKVSLRQGALVVASKS